ncbi:fumarylacetoacetate hydrolase family protein [Streptomyces sp. NPDC004237]|uniref:fumarylacetoacetate hydrolase family protein n=1 Tax=Streptomyces sp. NPDC004237 TaxID=3154455 RepID=UPI0033BDE99A
MRFTRSHTADGPVLCRLDQDGSAPRILWDEKNQRPYARLQELIGLSRDELARLATRPVSAPGKPLAPVVPDRNVFCVGRNYADHAAEFARSGFDATHSSGNGDIPDKPVIFTKPARSIIGPGDEIDPHLELTSALDYEGEIGIVISKPGYRITRKEAMDYVWGYTLINDVTARDLQRDHKQWFLGKSLDTFCPMGPWVVTADEVDPSGISLQTYVNDELRQDSDTSRLIFDIPAIIETLSAGMTLQPGDVIATGTPQGVGIGFTPPRYLKPGDEVVVRASGLGALRNTVGLSSPASVHDANVAGAAQ